VRAMIEAQGVPLHEEDLEKVFPVSRRARDVLDALLLQASAAGVDLRLGSPVLAVRRLPDGFALATPGGALRAASLVLATGGISYPKTGANGDGYQFCRAFGHAITETVPALAPLAVDAGWVHELQGIVLLDVELAALDGSGAELRRRRRPILFTHK